MIGPHIVNCLCRKCLNPNVKFGRKPGKFGKYNIVPNPNKVKKINIYRINLTLKTSGLKCHPESLEKIYDFIKSEMKLLNLEEGNCKNFINKLDKQIY